MLIQTYLKGKHLPDEIRTEMEGLQCVNEELLLRKASIQSPHDLRIFHRQNDEQKMIYKSAVFPPMSKRCIICISKTVGGAKGGR